MKWERIRHDHDNALDRASIPGGWLVMSTDDVTEYQGENDYKSGKSGYQWRTSITFVPDPKHEWDLEVDYAQRSREQEQFINKVFK